MSNVVWICDSVAVDGGSLEEVVDCEAAAMLWLDRRHVECAESARHMDEFLRGQAAERGRDVPKPWKYTPIEPRERGGFQFTEGCDTYRIYPREVLTARSLQRAVKDL